MGICKMFCKLEDFSWKNMVKMWNNMYLLEAWFSKNGIVIIFVYEYVFTESDHVVILKKIIVKTCERRGCN